MKGNERGNEERARRGRGLSPFEIHWRERHSGPGWSPVNLLLILLSAQISSEDVLGPTSSRFLLSFDDAHNRPSFPGSLLRESNAKKDKQNTLRKRQGLMCSQRDTISSFYYEHSTSILKS